MLSLLQIVNPVTQANVEEFYIENFTFGGEAVSKKNTRYPDNDIPDQDYAPTPEQCNAYLRKRVQFPVGVVYQRAVITRLKRDLEGNLI